MVDKTKMSEELKAFYQNAVKATKDKAVEVAEGRKSAVAVLVAAAMQLSEEDGNQAEATVLKTAFAALGGLSGKRVLESERRLGRILGDT